MVFCYIIVLLGNFFPQNIVVMVLSKLFSKIVLLLCCWVIFSPKKIVLVLLGT